MATHKNLADVVAWLQERRNNAIIISAGKSGADKSGWLEDAEYLQAAIDALQAQRSSEGRADAGNGVTDAGSKPAAAPACWMCRDVGSYGEPPKQCEFCSLVKRRCIDAWASVNDPPCHPSDEGWRPCDECMPSATPCQIVFSIAAALQRGEPPAMILDENSPIRDAIREALK